MSDARSKARHLLAPLAVLLLGAAAGCMTYRAGPPPADVSEFPALAAQAKSEKPVHVTVEYRHYVNGTMIGEEAEPDAARKCRSTLLRVLRQMPSVPIVEEAPATGDAHRLLVAVKKEEIFDPIGPVLCGRTFALIPCFARYAYDYKAEFHDDKGGPPRSYAFSDSHKIAIQLFLLAAMPFNKNYTSAIAENLSTQLAIALAKDLQSSGSK